MRARAGIADSDADHALDELRMAHGELVAVEAATVVQQQRHALAWTHLVHHVANSLEHLIERIGALRRTRLEPRKGEAHAAVAVLQRRHLCIPQTISVGPAVNHHDGAGATALDDHCTVSSAACQTSSALRRTRTTLPCCAQRDSS